MQKGLSDFGSHRTMKMLSGSKRTQTGVLNNSFNRPRTSCKDYFEVVRRTGRGILSAVLLAACAGVAQAQDRQILSNHVPAVVAHLAPVDSLSATSRLDLTIG